MASAIDLDDHIKIRLMWKKLIYNFIKRIYGLESFRKLKKNKNKTLQIVKYYKVNLTL